MSLIDKVVAAVTPAASDEARLEARERAHDASTPGDWLEQVLDQHAEIEEDFEAVREAETVQERHDELRELAILLTGHSNAEESVLYPALAEAGAKGHATTAYAEQAEAKMQMALLEKLPPMSQQFLDKLEEIREAVAHHMYEEEGTWFLQLKAKGADQETLTARFEEEFNRYVGTDDPVDEDDDDAPATTSFGKIDPDSLPLR
jgi:predicted dienelactone hydrolase